MKEIELLSPAKNKDIAKQAVLHGADAIYVGPPMFGARKNASNSLDDIAEIIDFAHAFRVKVYVTLNTILFDHELKKAEELCRDLYHIGTDALIVQDLGILRLKIPPISLHASTQCDIRTPEKALFLEKLGFSQLVLARELTLKEIKDISSVVNIPLESFIHGALCVSYSGKCHASQYLKNRSANRGECAQICRLPFTLKDKNNKIIAKDKYLLSLKDFNASGYVAELIEAGISSFKIEGRLKENGYVKNVTAYYNNLLNNLIESNENLKLRRSSFGKSVISFEPALEKSFNRGFTSFFLSERNPKEIASLYTPKSLGEKISDIKLLNNGDGISYFDKDGNYLGALVNKVSDNRIFTSDKKTIYFKNQIYRTSDINRNKILDRKDTAQRKLDLSIEIDTTGVTAADEMGNQIRIPLGFIPEKSEKTLDYKKEFNKLGDSIFILKNYESHLSPDAFIPFSIISKLRREIISQLLIANKITYPFSYRRKEDTSYPYMLEKLDYRENVANKNAEKLYKDHGVKGMEPAMEKEDIKENREIVLMTSRHCILRELGLCKKSSDKHLDEPLSLNHGNNEFKLKFDCKKCEMQLIASH